MFNQTTTNPEIINLTNQAIDIRDYMNNLEMLSDLWTEEDEELFLFLDYSLSDLLKLMESQHVQL